MPTQNSGHVDVLLSNVSVAFHQSPNNFIASKVFPDISVMKQSNKYAIIPPGDFNRDEMMPLADGSETAGGSFELSTDSYFCDVFGFHKDIGPQARANIDDQFALDRNVTEYLTKKALIKKEKLFASQFFAASKWSTDKTGVAAAPGAGQFLQWNDTNSTPIEDVRSASTAQQLLTGGFRPNVFVVSRQVLDALLVHPDVIDRVKYGTQTDVAIAKVSQLTQLLEVEEIVVMNAIENTAKKGQPAVNAFIGGKSALLMYKTNAPGTMVPSAGYTFSWSGLVGTAGMGTTMIRMPLPLVSGGERLEIQMAFDMKMVAADMGTFFATAIA